MIKRVGIKKIISILLTMLFIIIIASPIVNAENFLDYNEVAGNVAAEVQQSAELQKEYEERAKPFREFLDGIKEFEKAGEGDEVDEINSEDLQTASGIIYNILLIIGIVAAVIVGLIIAMKFMIGSVEQKAEIKQTLIPYIVGCFIIFGAFGIWKVVLNILNQTV